MCGDGPEMIRFEHPAACSEDEMARRAAAFRELMAGRRSVRDFSDRPVPPAVIEDCLRAAASAPSGANCQPWHFVAVGDPAVKARLRTEAERVEREFYEKRAPREWLKALSPLGTGPSKPFLEEAPWLIAIFVETCALAPDGRRVRNYYPVESVGIATGLLIAALHQAGLAVLTYTPSPMTFLREVLGRPDNERPFLLLAVGRPAGDARVPDITKKRLEEISTFL